MTFTRGSRLSLALLASLLITVLVQAQQPASSTNPEQGSTTQAIPGFSQAAAGNDKSSIATSEATTHNKPGVAQVVKFGPGDLVDVSVYNVPELTTKARISNAGDIYLPLIDYVHIEGLTQEEAQALIEKRLTDGGFVRNPHVTIFVEEASSQDVTIMGEVGRPGIYPDIGDHRLYTIITQAGGFGAAASRKIAIVRRNLPDPIHIELPRNLSDDLSGNVEILPGDTINVPRAPIVYIVGDVNRPSALLMDNGQLTVMSALAMAGGANRTAKLGDARIIRRGPNGALSENRIQVKKMMEAKAPDVPLQADDILFIPVSGRKVAATRTIDAVVSTAMTLSIYSIPHP